MEAKNLVRSKLMSPEKRFKVKDGLIFFGLDKMKFGYRSESERLNTIGLIEEVFFGDAYALLDFRGAFVLDIGANIGDTALYFAKYGAKHVLAFEPYPKSYQSAVRNVSLNPNLSRHITLKNEGCAEKDGYINIDPGYESSGGTPLMNFSSGPAIKLSSFKTIINEYRICDAVLKMDCEGCEYNTILKTDPPLLYSSFREIVLEYHWGYLALKKHLESAGFATKIISKHIGWNQSNEIFDWENEVVHHCHVTYPTYFIFHYSAPEKPCRSW